MPSITNRVGGIIGGKSHTPADADFADGIWHALLVETAGVVKVTYYDDTVDSIYLAAGIWHPMQLKRVWSTGTDGGITVVHLGRLNESHVGDV